MSTNAGGDAGLGHVPVIEAPHPEKVLKPTTRTPTHERPTRTSSSERNEDAPELHKGTKYQQVKEIARRQKKKERHKRLDTDEILSSDDEDGNKIGMGLQLLQHMKKDTNEDALISDFEEAVRSKFDENELGPRFETPAVGSTMISWKVEDDLKREMDRAQKERSRRFLERRSASIKRLQGKGRELDLSNLSLGDKGASECATQLKGNTTLEVLVVSINSIGPEGATSLAKVLQSHPTLSALTVSRNQIGNEGLQALASSLRSCPHLTELRADFNDVGPSFPEELEHLVGLKTLGLRGNKLTEFPLHLLKSIETIDIDDNAPALRLSLEASLKLAEDGASKIANRKEAVSFLNQGWDLWKDLDMPKAQAALDAAKHKLQDSEHTGDLDGILQDAADLEEAIRNRREALGPGFVRLHDPQQVMVGESIEGAVRKIESGKAHISLFGQGVGDAGVTSISNALRSNANAVTFLDLESCNVGVQGVRELAKALDGNTRLETLILARNNLGDAGSRALAHALESNTTLVKLDVSRNQIGAAGSAAIARSVMANPSLKEMCFRLNNVRDEGATQVALALKSLRGLQELDLAGCGVGPRGSAVMTEELQFHNGLLHGKLWR